jgi:uncharacterized membrane protein (UPF0127 family)
MSAPRVWGRSAGTLAVVVLLWTVVACSGPPPSPEVSVSVTATASPTSAPLDSPAAVLPSGHRIELELAITPEEISQGLMYRPSLSDHRGMLFLFGQDRQPSFWMKNTLIPLDLVFLSRDGVVTEIIANAPPCAADPCPQYLPAAPARAVLEVTAGTASRQGLTAGAQLTFERVPRFPVVE